MSLKVILPVFIVISIVVVSVVVLSKVVLSVVVESSTKLIIIALNIRTQHNYT